MQKVTAPLEATDRFSRTIFRIAAELYWLKTYQAAMEGLTVDAIGLDFFRVSLNALKDARLIRLIRVLEDGSQSASFWYLLRSNEKLVREASKKSGLDLELLKELAEKLRGIRDKTFVHIDKDRVFDSQIYYEQAGITHDDVKNAIEGLWETMQALHISVFGYELAGDEYSGKDIKQLADLRDKYA